MQLRLKDFTSFYFVVSLFFISCGGNTNQSGTSTTGGSASVPTESKPTASSKPAEKARVSFKVNGVEAQTTPSGKDDDPQLGLLNWQNKYMSLSLMGDDPKFPHRGSLTLNVTGFKMEPASYTMSKDCFMSFSRYTTPNAGGETQYTAYPPDSYGTPEEKANNAKRAFTITYTKVEKIPSEFGEMYQVSGTFSGVATVKLGFKNEVSLLEITDGRFEDVPVNVLGK